MHCTVGGNMHLSQNIKSASQTGNINVISNKHYQNAPRIILHYTMTEREFFVSTKHRSKQANTISLLLFKTSLCRKNV